MEHVLMADINRDWEKANLTPEQRVSCFEAMAEVEKEARQAAEALLDEALGLLVKASRYGGVTCPWCLWRLGSHDKDCTAKAFLDHPEVKARLAAQKERLS